jgi:hypothetical protein
MNKATMLLTFVLMGCATKESSAQVPPTANVQAPRWDYMIQSVPDLSFDTVMSELGGAGWELIFARRASNGGTGGFMVMSYECIFKRPRSTAFRTNTSATQATTATPH